MLVIQLFLTPCHPMDCILPGSVYGILQARILECVVFPSPGYLPDPGTELGPPALQAEERLRSSNPNFKAIKAHMLAL